LNESQQFQVTRLNNGEPEETYQIRRFYLTDYRGIGGTGLNTYYDYTAFSLTYRDHGKNTKEMFVARSDSFPDIQFPEEGVVELRMHPEDGSTYDCNLVLGARVIDFAENGTTWEYRN